MEIRTDKARRVTRNVANNQDVVDFDIKSKRGQERKQDQLVKANTNTLKMPVNSKDVPKRKDTKKAMIIAKIFGPLIPREDKERKRREPETLRCQIPLHKIPKYRDRVGHAVFQDQKQVEPTKAQVKNEYAQVQVERSVESKAVQTTCEVGRSAAVEADTFPVPDSSISPTQSPRPCYHSYFEKKSNVELDAIDHEVAFEYGRHLKNQAKNASILIEKVSLCLESVVYFILADKRFVSEPAKYSYYQQTLEIIKFIILRLENNICSVPVPEAKILILSWRCHAIITLRVICGRLENIKNNALYFETFLKEKQKRHPHSLTNDDDFSSAESEHQISPIRMAIELPREDEDPREHYEGGDDDASVMKGIKNHLHKANKFVCVHDMWNSADNLVTSKGLEEFFISLDRLKGPLTFHSLLGELAIYLKQAINLMKDAKEIPETDYANSAAQLTL